MTERPVVRERPVWSDLRAGLRAVKRSGLLAPHPAVSLWQLARSVARHGVSLYTVAAWNAQRWPERVAVHDAAGPVSFRGLLALADRSAGALARHPEAGRGVGLLCRNHVSFVAALLACGRLGLRAAPLNPASPAEDLRAAAHSLGLLICDDDLAGRLEPLGLPLVTISALTVSALNEARAARSPGRPRRRGSIVLHTSGTTGHPRPLERRPRVLPLLRTLGALLERLPLRSGARTLLTLPMFHGHGLSTLALCLTLGAPLHLSARSAPREHWRRLREDKIEVVVLVPTVLYRLLDSPLLAPVPPLNAPSLKAIVCGSAPLGAALAERALQAFGPVLHNLYGASETGLISHATPAQLLAAPGTVGSALPGTRVEVRVGGRLATAGEVGRVTVRGALAVAGTPNGFHDTGDLGHLTASGLLELRGRQDDLLIIGGENVWPEAVEAQIGALPGVQECAVGGLSCAEYGQALQAWLVLREPPTPATLARLERDLAALLPRRLRPVRLHIVGTLPRNALGKLLRAQLGQADLPERLSANSPARRSSG